MKNKLFVCVFVFISGTTFSQAVFCPPGATWSALFSNNIWSQSTKNTTIVYERDSIEGLDTLKLLRHLKFYGQCNMSTNLIYTLIKQKGDTVFMRNRFTQNNWQILFNYACTTGQGWTTTYTLQNTPSSRTYSIVVDSVSTTIENGFSLRKLSVSVNYNYNSFTAVNYQTSIYERYGWGFLFSYRNNSGACDADYFLGSLCYSDNNFGVKYFGSSPCDFQNPSAVNEINPKGSLSFYPNPANDFLEIKTDGFETFITIANEMGSIVLSKKINTSQQIDLSGIAPGVYFIQYNNGLTLRTEKLIKLQH